jgi:hypothetical protein
VGLDAHLTGSVSILKQQPELYVDGFAVQAVEVKLGYWRSHWKLQEFIARELRPNTPVGSPMYTLYGEDIQRIIDALSKDELCEDVLSWNTEEAIRDFQKILVWYEKDPGRRSLRYHASW